MENKKAIGQVAVSLKLFSPNIKVFLQKVKEASAAINELEKATENLIEDFGGVKIQTNQNQR